MNTIVAIDENRKRSTADIVVKNQAGYDVAVARHRLKWVQKNHVRNRFVGGDPG
ncbi:MAG: hypothetical protein JO232_23690 [Verrucomicrobia bacterium]|nr:hypothetical protein [Verrucomicrobiota bacterium]